MAKHDGVLLTVAVPSSQIAALCYTFCSVNLERFNVEDWEEGRVLETSVDGDLVSLQELKGLFDSIVDVKTTKGQP
jgi:hypothetical protein